MVKIYPRITICGDNFSPKKVENDTDMLFSNKNEKGEIAKQGRYKGKPLPYGSADIIPPNTLQGEKQKLLYIIDKYNKSKNKIKEFDDIDIVFHIDVDYQNQCNLAFDVDILEKIANLKIPVTISCWENDEDK